MTEHKYEYRKLRMAVKEAPDSYGTGKTKENKELMQGYKILRKGNLKEVLDVRLYATRRQGMEGYQWCAAIWVFDLNMHKSWFSPMTTGGGYDKVSTCVYEAIPRNVQDHIPAFDGVGESAMEDALMNIAKAIVGTDSKVHMVKFHA